MGQKNYFDLFIEYLKIERKSSLNTVSAYEKDVLQFINYSNMQVPNLPRALDDVLLSGSWPHAVHSAVTVFNCENTIKSGNLSCYRHISLPGRVCMW